MLNLAKFPSAIVGVRGSIVSAAGFAITSTGTTSGGADLTPIYITQCYRNISSSVV